MPAVLRKAARRVLVLGAVLGSGLVGLGADGLVFGPETYYRRSGRPVTVTRTFRVDEPSAIYTLRVVNRGVTSAFVWVNGRIVLSPNDFSRGRDEHGNDDRKGDSDRDDHDDDDDRRAITRLQRRIRLRPGINSISVELRSKPGTSLTVEIRGEGPDNESPTAHIAPAPSAFVGQPVLLDGRGSSDPEGRALSYDWSITARPSGSTATVVNGSAAVASFVPDRPGSYRITLVVSDGALTDDASLTITTTNSLPVANAGPDQTVAVNDIVQLTGAASVDIDGDPLTYAWRFQSHPVGSLARISNPETVNPTFIPDLPGTYALELVVGDGTVSSAPDTVVISTANSPPVAHAGPDQTAIVGALVQLNGAASSDVDGQALEFLWAFVTRPSGSTAALSSATAVLPTFVVDKPGTYELQLVVRDPFSSSVPDTVRITAENSPPIANAGADQTAPLDAVVLLNGDGSTDVDGDPLSFIWALLSKPVGSTATLSDPSAVAPTFHIDQPGTYIAQLIVNDGTAASASDTVIVDTRNSLPIANAGPDQTVALDATVTLDGIDSLDVDHDLLSYRWSLISVPPGSVAQLTTPEMRFTSFVADRRGNYVAQLIVSDGTGNSAPDSVTISTSNSIPIAHAGPDQLVALASTVLLDGHASFDPDGTPLTFEWALTSTPAGSDAVLSDPNAIFPTFTADIGGTFVAQLIVRDDVTSSAPDTVTVVVAENHRPVANAGGDQHISVGTVVTLDGNASSDAEGHPLTYAWALVVRPVGSNAVLSATGAAVATFTADVPGEYVALLRVSDGALTSNDDVVVTADSSPGNRPPIVDAGADQNVTLPSRPLPTNYTLRFLPQLEGGTSLVGDMNDLGEVVGAARSATQRHPVLWRSGTVFPLPTGSEGHAAAISINGWIGGHSFLVEGGTVLNAAPSSSGAMGMNRLGDLVGQAEGSSGANLPFLFKNRELTFLPLQPGGSAGHAISVNDDGLIAGIVYTGSSQFPAQWLKGELQLLPTLGGDATGNNWAYDVNALGDIVGQLRDPLGNHKAVLWRGGELFPLDPMVSVSSGTENEVAISINDRREVLRASKMNTGEAVRSWVWKDGSSVELTPFIAPHNTRFILRTLNNHGQIAGYLGVNSDDPATRAFVLDPGPTSTQVTVPLAGTVSDDGLPPDVPLDVFWSQVSGPETVTFADVKSPTTTTTVSKAGTYVFRLTANDSLAASSDEITITVAATNNDPPTVDAGADQHISLASGASLLGTVSDDGLPAEGPVTYQWWTLEGPGAVSFSAPDQLANVATFSAAGRYVLRLVANDGVLSNADDVTVVVSDESENQAPVVSAGPNQTVPLSTAALLTGSATDDGLPSGSALAYSWSVVDGPGTVTFADPFAPLTTASFDAIGTYILRLTVSDSVLSSSDDVEIVVTPLDAAVPVLLSITPSAGLLGQSNLIVTIVGQDTHFTNASVLDLGAGISVASVEATDSTHLSASLSIARDATVGPRTLRVSSGTEIAVLSAAFSVSSGTPEIVSVVSDSAAQGQELTVVITGRFTNFVSGQTEVSFGQGISVGGAAHGGYGPVFVTSATTAIASLGMAPRPTWEPLDTGGPGPTKYQHTLVFDPVSNQMILFGGRLSFQPAELWRLSNANGTVSPSVWSRIMPLGPQPSGRAGSSGVYDPVSDRMVVYSGDCVNELWILSSASGRTGTPTWIPVSPTGALPPARYAHSAVYDPASNRMIILGGNNCSTTEFTDVWVLSNANGTEITPPAWTQLAPIGPIPGPSVVPALAYDAEHNRLMLFGQLSNMGIADGIPTLGPGIVWILENANGLGGSPQWTKLNVEGLLPPTRGAGGIAYDASTNQLLVIATNGYDSPGLDTWVLSNANGLGGVPAWKRQGPFPTLPAARYNYPNGAAAYDAEADRFILFGGLATAVGPPFNETTTTDTWVLQSALRGAVVGPRSLGVRTGSELLSRTNSFVVTPSAAGASAMLSPGYGPRGVMGLTVTITAENTQFQEGVTQANFGPGVSVGGAPPGDFGPVAVTSSATAEAYALPAKIAETLSLSEISVEGGEVSGS